MVDDKNIMYRNITNQKVIDFMDSYYKPLSDELGELRIKAEAENVPVLQRDAERNLISLLRIHQPSSIVEVGTAVGYSASCMATALPNVKIATYEKSPEMAAKARGNFERLGLEDRITLVEGDAVEMLKALPPETHFDFAFIDAAKGHYRDFWELILPHMSSGGVIVCDNMLFKARVVSDEYDVNRRFKTEVRRIREFIDYLFTLEDIETSLLSVGDGTTISVIL